MNVPSSFSFSHTSLLFLLSTILSSGGCCFALQSLLASAQSITAAAESAPKVRESIRGRVVDENGHALSDARVEILGAGSPLRNARTAQCDIEGRFLFDGIMPGLYRLRALAPAYVMTEYPAEADAEESYYQPGDTATLRMTKGGVISGTVTNAAGEVAVAVIVSVMNKGKRGRFLSPYQEETITDDRGVYRIYGLPAGDYLVQAGGGAITRFMLSPYQQEGSVFLLH